jgi:acyl-CoA thioesterase YciA
MEKVTSKLCMQKDLGVNGNLFGGNMMAWLDEAAAIYAHQATGERKMVTKKFNELIFLKPIKEGDIIMFFCETVKVGTTSIEIHIEVAKDTNTFGLVKLVETNCVFVCLDADGNKKEIGK